ncbi:MAG: Gfo/Idh/MocA family oxidoreductase [Anaerolineales bacterium]|nr:Gfo/Idh/MocA family oxidoreductase [Anaerolineales bacterium]
MLGYAFMGRAHSNAMKKIPYMIYPPPAVPKLTALCGRDEEAVAEVAARFGYEGYYTDWRKMLENEEIQLFDNGGPNDVHAAPCIMAAEAGMHILCEKPLARTAEEAKLMLDAVDKAGVKHMVAFNYRFVPAIRQIRYLIDSGVLGRIYHWRAVYLQEWILPHFGTEKIWRLDKEVAGSGAIGDLGAHIIDLAHYLVGGIKSLSAYTSTFIEERDLPDGTGPGVVDVDDAFISVAEFENGALGTFECTRLAAGRRNYNCFEINGEKASIRFNLERMNEFDIFYVDHEPEETLGWTNVLVTEDYHPWLDYWWPPGHIIGWEHTFVHEIAHLLDCIVNDNEVGPHGATFVDGYRTAVICDAIAESGLTGKRIDVKY